MPKKVIHLVRKLLPFTASFIRNQIIYHTDYEPSVIYAEKIETPFFEEIRQKHQIWCAVDGNYGKFLYNKFRKLTNAEKRKINELIKTQNPDILHLHYGVDALVFSDVIKKSGIPAVVSFYGYDCTSFPKRFNGYGKTLLQKKVFANPAVKKVFAMSEDMKNDLLSIGCPDEKLMVHYYGTETKPFGINRDDNKTNNTVNFTILSGLFDKKGHMILLDAFVDAQKTIVGNTHLHIIGDGILKEPILEKIKQTGLKNISFHGPVVYGSEKHMNFLKTSDVFIHPSITPPNGDKEGIPGVIIEAMAAGLPVISTYHAGIPYVIENNKTGLLVPEYDVKELSLAISKIANNAEMRVELGKNAQQFARTDLDVETKELELENIYDQVISNQKYSS